MPSTPGQYRVPALPEQLVYARGDESRRDRRCGRESRAGDYVTVARVAASGQRSVHAHRERHGLRILIGRPVERQPAGHHVCQRHSTAGGHHRRGPCGRGQQSGHGRVPGAGRRHVGGGDLYRRTANQSDDQFNDGRGRRAGHRDPDGCAGWIGGLAGTRRHERPQYDVPDLHICRRGRHDPDLDGQHAVDARHV